MRNGVPQFWDWEWEWKTVLPNFGIGNRNEKQCSRPKLGKNWLKNLWKMLGAGIPAHAWSSVVQNLLFGICAPNAPCRTFLAPCCIFSAPCHTFLAPCHTFSAPCPMPKITCNFWCFSSSFSLSCFIPFSPFLPVNSLNFTKGVWHRLP